MRGDVGWQASELRGSFADHFVVRYYLYCTCAFNFASEEVLHNVLLIYDVSYVVLQAAFVYPVSTAVMSYCLLYHVGLIKLYL